jgi:hypothetical protein
VDYSYYFHCLPRPGDYDIHCHAYHHPQRLSKGIDYDDGDDNRWLLPELGGKHELPNDCYSVLPSTGELILIVLGEKGYFPQGQSVSDPDINRQVATARNTLLGITRAQEEALLSGSLFGWDTPAARPWNYDQNGKPCMMPDTGGLPQQQEGSENYGKI